MNGIGIVVAQRLMRHRRSGGSTASRSRKAGAQPDVASGVPQRSIFTKASFGFRRQRCTGVNQ